MGERLRQALRQHFGHDGFRAGQEAMVEAICAGRDTLVVMPTGGGKSLCYQLPAVLAEGTALVVSPLISLMKDQVDALTARGVPATFINSSLSPSEQGKRLRQLESGSFKLVYVAPERFRQNAFIALLRRIKLSFVAVDEAHCISQWGHDFRPDYLRVGEVLTQLDRPPVSAFTATATRDVQADVERVLGLREPAVFVTGFARPNLDFEVRTVKNRAAKEASLSQLLARDEAGIIYCATRKRVEEVSTLLDTWKIGHVAYHGGLEDAARETLQDRFLRGQVRVAVATNAFGMGIDRSDLRFVLHYELPGSVEAYYQEAGRAGRDGLPARCILLYNYADRRTQDFFIDGANPSPAFVRSVYHQLHELCDDRHEVHRTIDDLAELVGCKNGMQVGTALKLLQDAGLIERFDLPGERMRGTRLRRPELLPFQVELDEDGMAEKERRDRSRLEGVLSYATCLTCRQQWIRDYFGETDPERCGRCDRCGRSRQEGARSLHPDEMLLLRKLLSGIARMSQRDPEGAWVARFGKGLILKMLAGSSDRRIRDLHLDRLSTYGLLKTLPKSGLEALCEAAADAGLLHSTGGLRPLLTLTAKGAAVMREEEMPAMVWPAGMIASPAPASRPRRLGSVPELELSAPSAPDADLVQALKRKRLQLARARGNAPPYTILNNRALEGLARLRPATPEDAMRVPGIGPGKARSVVPAFIGVIQSWQQGTREAG